MPDCDDIALHRRRGPIGPRRGHRLRQQRCRGDLRHGLWLPLFDQRDVRHRRHRRDPRVGERCAELAAVGTVASGGTSVTATSITVLQVAASATYGLEGNVEGVAAGTSADSFVVTLLGQSVTVNAATRLADRSSRASGAGGDSGTNPFNITTFQTYLAASTSQHVLVRTQADASGNL